MVIAVGVAKQLRYKAESSWGVAPGATDAQLLRRVESTLDLRKETYQSNEIRTDYQLADMRHGVRSVEGALRGEISPGTYQDFFAAACRQAFQSAATSGALTTVTAAATAPQFVRSAGSWISAGFKVGDVVRWTGWASPATANNSRNFFITALTATDMSGIFLDGSAVAAKAAGDSVTATLAGKKTWVPSTGHTDPSFAFEHWFADVAQSELFLGCKLNRLGLELPPTGISTITLDFMGKDAEFDTSEYFTTPDALTTTGVCAAVNGALIIDNATVALLTGLTINIAGNMSAEAVVGSNVYPDIFEGRVTIDGQFTAFFEDETFRDLFVNETEAGLAVALTTGNSATADFIAIALPRIKVGGAGKDDGEKGLVQTLPFVGLLNSAGGATLDTTISIQDSQAA